jgi:hypothetical protein
MVLHNKQDGGSAKFENIFQRNILKVKPMNDVTFDPRFNSLDIPFETRVIFDDN